MGTWYREAGEYEFVIPGVAGADTLLTLELSTEICSGLEGDALQAGIRIYPNPACFPAGAEVQITPWM